MTLGLGGGSARDGNVEVGFRAGWVRYFKIALSSAGGAAVFIAVFELLQKQPVAGFGLLISWGPWPIVALVALAIAGQFGARMNETVSVTFGAVVSSVQQGTESQAKAAEAAVKTAEALGKLADQGGRHAQEVERLTIFAVQEFPIIHERLDKQDAMLREIHGLVSRGKANEENAS